MKRTNEAIVAMKKAEEIFKKMNCVTHSFGAWCEQETDQGNMNMSCYYDKLDESIGTLNELYMLGDDAVTSVSAWIEDGEEDSEYYEYFCSKYLTQEKPGEGNEAPDQFCECEEDPDWYEYFTEEDPGEEDSDCYDADDGYNNSCNEKDAIINELRSMYGYCYERCEEILKWTKAYDKYMWAGWRPVDLSDYNKDDDGEESEKHPF